VSNIDGLVDALRRNNKRLWALFVTITILLIFTSCPYSYAQKASLVSGVIRSESTGTPIPDSTVSVWSGSEFIVAVQSDTEGKFSFHLEEGEEYCIYAYADDPESQGVDYIPRRVEYTHSIEGVDDLVLSLEPGASLILEGDVQMVFTENLPISIFYSVTALESKTPLVIGGFPMIYGTLKGSQSHFLGINSSQIIVPVNSSFTIWANVTTIKERTKTYSIFEVNDTRIQKLHQGASLHLDVREHSLRLNIEILEDLYREVSEEIFEMDKEGFYLTVEKEILANNMNLVKKAEIELDIGKHIDSFHDLRISYVSLVDLSKRGYEMHREAQFSVIILVFFIGFMSTTISYFIANSTITKVGGSCTASIFSSWVLYITYPGIRFIDLGTFTAMSALALAISLFIVTILPRYLQSRETKEKTSLRNTIVPILMISKRGLLRRKLRFALTLTSVITFVMAFVILTSFSQGYGLITRQLSGGRPSADSVLIRDKNWRRDQVTFLALDPISMDWLERQPESAFVASKAENIPTLNPISKLFNLGIYGILGLDPTVEPHLTGIDQIVSEGRFLSGGRDEILLCSEVGEELGLKVGDAISFMGRELRIVGFYEDSRLERIKDLDSSNIVPKKLVLVNPEGELIEIALEDCEPEEIIICSTETALSFPLTGITRLNVGVSEGVESMEFAERLVLERGYRVWSLSPEGLYLNEYGSYLRGTGLSVFIPGIIVILNVSIMILNSIYERKKEINILSSLGLNPGQISSIFIGESLIIGLIGGGIGYLLGLSFYRIMTWLQISVEVSQKVSAFWSLAAISVSMSAVLVGTVFALKISVVVTPSLIRRWKIEDQERGVMEPYTIAIPVKVREAEVSRFMEHVVATLYSYLDHAMIRTDRIEAYSDDPNRKKIKFVYRQTDFNFGNFYSVNEIVINRAPFEEVFKVKLISTGELKWVHESGTFVRQIVMSWSTKKDRRMKP